MRPSRPDARRPACRTGSALVLLLAAALLGSCTSTWLAAGVPPARPNARGRRADWVASYTYLDQLAPHENPAVTLLRADSLPRLGRTFCVHVGSPLSTSTSLFTGSLRSPPFDVSRVRKLGCGWLMVRALVVENFGPGEHDVEYPIPADPSLLGATFHQQVLVQERASADRTYVMSRVGVGVVGR